MDRTDNHEDDLIVDCVHETQNVDQFISQAMHVVEVIANMHEGGLDNFPSTPNFLFPCARVGGSSLAMDGKLTIILKHIRIWHSHSFCQLHGPHIVEAMPVWQQCLLA